MSFAPSARCHPPGPAFRARCELSLLHASGCAPCLTTSLLGELPAADRIGPAASVATAGVAACALQAWLGSVGATLLNPAPALDPLGIWPPSAAVAATVPSSCCAPQPCGTSRPGLRAAKEEVARVSSRVAEVHGCLAGRTDAGGAQCGQQAITDLCTFTADTGAPAGARQRGHAR